MSTTNTFIPPTAQAAAAAAATEKVCVHRQMKCDERMDVV